MSAEAQAACEATDSLMYASIFWNLLWEPYLPLNDIQTGKMENPPKLVIDAKALYNVLTKEEIQKVPKLNPKLPKLASQIGSENRTVVVALAIHGLKLTKS